MATLNLKAKIALIGDAGVGKTSLIRRFVLDEFSDGYLTTVGTKVTKIRLTIPQSSSSEVDLDLSIFDIVGDKGFRDLVRETHFHDLQGLLGVCDVTNAGTLTSLTDWIRSALRISGDIPAFLLVNKSDLSDRAMFGDSEVGKLALPLGAPFLYTSAKTGDGVDDAFNSLALEILSNALARLGEREAKRAREGELLDILASRGLLGATKTDLFSRIPGIRYDDLKAHVEELESRGLVKLQWNGPTEFTVFITPKGMGHSGRKVSPSLS